MASIQKDFIIDANPGDVWDALRDFGALHTRLVPGFVTDTKLDGDARIGRIEGHVERRDETLDLCDEALDVRDGRFGEIPASVAFGEGLPEGPS